MNFKRYGTSYHPVLHNAENLRQGLRLDESLWVATSAPVSAFRMDPEFLRCLDSDQDLRVKCGELEEAVEWMFSLLDDLSGVDTASTTLQLSHFRADSPEALEIQTQLRLLSPENTAFSLKQIRDGRKRLEAKPVSETGVVLPDAADTPEIRQFLEDLLRVMDGAEHPSGQKGVTLPLLDRFQQLSAQRLEWLARPEQCDELARSLIPPLGADTPAAFHTYRRVKAAIDHFFLLCDAINLDPAALQQSWPGLPEPLNWEDDSAVNAALRSAPLAKPNAERILRFDRDLNPAWTRDLHDFRQKVILPLLDRTDEVLTPQVWKELGEKMEAYGTWLEQEPGHELEILPPGRLLEMQDPALRAQVLNLLEHQTKSAIDLHQIRKAEKLALYQGLLLEFANNFMAFPYLYDPDKRAGFEMGTLIMDGRRFNLSVQVPDRAAYLKGIEGGTMFIMIVELTHTLRKEKFEIA
ncbi:MAG: hypothetical protein ACO3NW_09515, partial [Kiritimatiellia bacterium]